MRKKVIFILLSLSLILSACGKKAAPIPPLSAALSELQGTVMGKQTGQSDYTRVASGYVLEQNGEIKTEDDGRVRLDLSTGTIVRIAPSSLFTLVSNVPTANNSLSSTFKLDLGQIWIVLSSGTADVQTPSGVASVRGSYLMVEVVPGGGVKLTCLEGSCNIQNASGNFPLTTGQSAFILNTQTAPFIQTMTEDEVNQWLAANPEATLVVPSLTAPAPSATAENTATSAPTATSVPPTATTVPATATSAPTATNPPPAAVYIPPQPPQGAPPATPDPNALYFDISNININGGRFNVNVSAGAPVTVNFIYLLWNQANCQSCIDQLVVGLDSGQGRTGYGCGYDSIPGGYPGSGPSYSSATPITFPAPDVPGTYQVGIDLIQDFSCSQAMPAFGTSASYKVIGSIVVP